MCVTSSKGQDNIDLDPLSHVLTCTNAQSVESFCAHIHDSVDRKGSGFPTYWREGFPSPVDRKGSGTTGGERFRVLSTPNM